MSKVGIIADIHSNLPALETALQILKEQSVDRIIVCGDIVGYGKSPNECCDRIRALSCPVVAGNHDWAVAGLTEYRHSHSRDAVRGIDFTKRVITPENLSWLESLPLYYTEGDMEFVHSSLVRPEEWYYLTLGSSSADSAWQDVQDNFTALRGKLCFVGHSHVPTIFLEKGPKNIKVIRPSRPSYDLQGNRAIIDVGSIGQPRTSSKRAAFLIYDTGTHEICFKRFTLRAIG